MYLEPWLEFYNKPLISKPSAAVVVLFLYGQLASMLFQKKSLLYLDGSAPKGFDKTWIYAKGWFYGQLSSLRNCVQT